MVALLVCTIILGCFESKTTTQKAREYLLHDKNKAVQFIQSLSKEEQIYIVTRLSEEFPQQVTPLCSIVQGEVQKRCMRIAKRPHLWTSTHPPSDQTVSEECVHPHICFEQEAMTAIEKGNIPDAMQACTKIKDFKWSHECMFHSAEHLLEHDIEQYASTLIICEESGQFRNHCIQHGIFALVSNWLKKGYEFDTVEQKIKSITYIWDKHDEKESPYRIDQLWAHWMYRFAENKPMSSDTIPANLLAHHHSNIALFSIQFASKIEEDLEKHVVQIQRNKLITRKKRRGMEPMMNLWNAVPKGKSYLGYSLRLTDENPNIDLLIATLEAIARLQPPQMSRIVPYTKHDHPKVKETAQRLLLFDVTQPEIGPISYENTDL